MTVNLSAHTKMFSELLSPVLPCVDRHKGLHWRQHYCRSAESVSRCVTPDGLSLGSESQQSTWVQIESVGRMQSLRFRRISSPNDICHTGSTWRLARFARTLPDPAGIVFLRDYAYSPTRSDKKQHYKGGLLRASVIGYKTRRRKPLYERLSTIRSHRF